MSKKKTGWYLSNQKPARKGVYETRTATNPVVRYQMWNGKRWLSYCGTPEMAAACTLQSGIRKSPEWRGFTTQQTKGTK